MELRLEEEKDYAETEHLTREAFWNKYRPGCSEHLILHRLRTQKSFVPELDYVAVEDGRLVGNIAYSRLFTGGTLSREVLCFGPVSVHPDFQGTGIGGRLISETLLKAKTLGYKAVLITGSPEYYCRFGFTSASTFGITLPGMAEGEEAPFFMAKELELDFLKTHGGVYEFDPCFEVDEKELDVFDRDFPSKLKREALESDL